MTSVKKCEITRNEQFIRQMETEQSGVQRGGGVLGKQMLTQALQAGPGLFN